MKKLACSLSVAAALLFHAALDVSAFGFQQNLSEEQFILNRLQLSQLAGKYNGNVSNQTGFDFFEIKVKPDGFFLGVAWKGSIYSKPAEYGDTYMVTPSPSVAFLSGKVDPRGFLLGRIQNNGKSGVMNGRFLFESNGRTITPETIVETEPTIHLCGDFWVLDGRRLKRSVFGGTRFEVDYPPDLPHLKGGFITLQETMGSPVNYSFNKTEILWMGSPVGNYNYWYTGFNQARIHVDWFDAMKIDVTWDLDFFSRSSGDYDESPTGKDGTFFNFVPIGFSF